MNPTNVMISAVDSDCFTFDTASPDSTNPEDLIVFISAKLTT